MREKLVSRSKKIARHVVSRLRRRKRVRIEHLLRGGEQMIPAALYSRITEAPLRPSTPCALGPHAVLLNTYRDRGEDIFKCGNFEQTEYYKNAVECIDLTGAYFPDVKCESQIVQVARNFVNHVVHDQRIDLPRSAGYSGTRTPVFVRKISHSNCYEVIDGNHRIAAAAFRGESEIGVVVAHRPVMTPVQQQLLDVMWQQGRLELYQPIDLPETKNWHVVRRCEDRLQLVKSFLEQQNLNQGSYLDIGSSYGYFVSKMDQFGFHAAGVERDPMAKQVGEIVYGNRTNAVTRSDVVKYLRNETTKFDVTSCFSVLHHFALGRGSTTAEEFIRLIDKVTGQILFFDTGESGEEWFCENLAQWNPGFIADWIKNNTSFTRVIPLGKDEDSRPPYDKNYGRTLFACVRS